MIPPIYFGGLFLLLVGIPLPVSSIPLTKLQFFQVKKLLEEKVKEEYPSDDADYYADLLQQSESASKKLLLYHQGKPSQPVFLSFDLANLGKPFHVLLRGEDYMNPKDINNYIVLKQTSEQDKYSVHMAHVVNMTDIKNSEVVWNEGRIEQQPKLEKLLDQLGNSEVQSRSISSKRPRCGWIGLFLLCNSKYRLKPLRERQTRKPLDEVDEAPKRPPEMSEETYTKGNTSDVGVRRYLPT